ncbi:unnamed protein product [Peronospora destructor]|uniref:Helicase ATP-binding domain-containing protein n=1 Tax=Peronospora destructor TaxID=86335 RepID=A0AAV0T6M3_9STRA|nr:unnamed protein product [Peronospora destructor]
MEATRPMEKSYLIMGYNVEFPSNKEPFPAQFALMNKVLTALKTKQHALLESPTGSGKTLALLCSILTFQKQFLLDQVMAIKKNENDPKFQEQETKKEAQKAQLRALEAQKNLMEAREQIEQARKQRQEIENNEMNANRIQESTTETVQKEEQDKR